MQFGVQLWDGKPKQVRMMMEKDGWVNWVNNNLVGVCTPTIMYSKEELGCC